MTRIFHVYALVDPATHIVRYVGKTTNNPARRLGQHIGGHAPATREWVRSLSLPPTVVILEAGESRRVAIGRKGQKTVRVVAVDSAIVAETKWIKRFRRTLINRKLRGNCGAVWDKLVNSEEGSCLGR